MRPLLTSRGARTPEPLRVVLKSMRQAFRQVMAIETAAGEMLLFGANSDEVFIPGGIAARLELPHVLKVLSRSADLVLTEQRSGVKVLGIEFYATSLFANRMRHDDPESIRFDFDQMDSGGNVENCRGYWSITDFSSPGLKLSYVRYRVEFEALAQYPGQESIMRNLGAGDIERTMRELGLRAVKKTSED